jgi:hypothetical protein
VTALGGSRFPSRLAAVRVARGARATGPAEGRRPRCSAEQKILGEVARAPRVTQACRSRRGGCVPTARPPGAAFALASGPRGERAALGQGMRELRLPHGDPVPAAGVGAFHVGRCPDTARRDVRAAEAGPGAGLDPGGTEDGIRCCCAASGVRLLAGPGTTKRASAAVAPRRGVVGIDDGADRDEPRRWARARCRGGAGPHRHGGGAAGPASRAFTTPAR